MVRRVMAALAACVLLVGCAEPQHEPRLFPDVSISAPGWTRVGADRYSVDPSGDQFLYRMTKPVGDDAAVLSVRYRNPGGVSAETHRNRLVDSYQQSQIRQNVSVLDEVLIGGKPAYGVSYYYVDYRRWVHAWYVDCMDTYQCVVFLSSPRGADGMDPSLVYVLTGLEWGVVDVEAEGYTWPDEYTPPEETPSPTSSR